MATKWIQTAWIDNGDGPELLSAYDELTFDAWGGTPLFYQEAISVMGEDVEVRECRIEVDATAIEALFSVPTIKGEVSS